MTHGVLQLDSPEPLWRQAAARIRHGIDDGSYAQGSRLPSERELGESLEISRVTLRKALQSLVEEGVLSSQHGRGWFVASATRTDDWPNSLESFTETARRMGLTATSTVLEALSSPASLDEAELLAIAPGTLVHRIARVRLLDGVPISLDRAIVPAAVAPELLTADWNSASLYSALERAGVWLGRADSTIEAGSADAAAASALHVEPGSPLLTMRQLVTDHAERPVLLSRIAYAGERYRLRTTFTRG